MDLEKELLAVEEAMWAANRAGDGAYYDAALRPDAVLVSRYGVAGKEQIVPLIQRNENPYVRSEISDHRVVRVSADSALITYRASYTALIDGSEVDFTAYATSVYAREGGEWRSVFHQQTAL